MRKKIAQQLEFAFLAVFSAILAIVFTMKKESFVVYKFRFFALFKIYAMHYFAFYALLILCVFYRNFTFINYIKALYAILVNINRSFYCIFT